MKSTSPPHLLAFTIWNTSHLLYASELFQKHEKAHVLGRYPTESQSTLDLSIYNVKIFIFIKCMGEYLCGGMSMCVQLPIEAIRGCHSPLNGLLATHGGALNCYQVLCNSGGLLTTEPSFQQSFR